MAFIFFANNSVMNEKKVERFIVQLATIAVIIIIIANKTWSILAKNRFTSIK